MARLTVMSGRRTIDVLELREERMLVGRGRGVDILLDSPVVSREHAELIRTGDSYLINNLAGKNGVFVNGQWIETLELADGDLVEIGKFTLKFEEVTSEETMVGGDEDPFGVPHAGRPVVGRHDVETVAWGLDEMAEVREAMAIAKQPHLEERAADGQTLHGLDRPKTTVGKAPDCHIRIESGWRAPKISAVIFRDPGGRFSVEPVKGDVKVNGTTISRETALASGDFVEVAGTRFKYLAGIE